MVSNPFGLTVAVLQGLSFMFNLWDRGLIIPTVPSVLDGTEAGPTF